MDLCISFLQIFQLVSYKNLPLILQYRHNKINGPKNMPMMLFEKQMLRKRSIIETVFDYLKNKFEMEHTRHRSVWNFLVHIMATLVTYSMKTTKPKVTMNCCLAAA